MSQPSAWRVPEAVEQSGQGLVMDFFLGDSASSIYSTI
ncbi:hypothetical protein M878_25430 [Streptomyces roseochromogenus subsp. oscitans DS 12.976]|uniref:Uncharacterized protein n=1 Tax=Streptomyces roseochromogenus subsp. oscitans DS 12.976 TaxID=1352936 RepID=V6K5L4_STRRC|nr:hypothetical protein M878_25430 [Streptomyces roseochromogenus subsp. oscitans DS 12.976]